MAQESTKNSRNKELGQAFNTKLHVYSTLPVAIAVNAMNMYTHKGCLCTSPGIVFFFFMFLIN